MFIATATPVAGQQSSALQTGEAPPASQASPDGGESGLLDFLRKTEVAGTVDMYFHYNFNEPLTGSLTPLRNFDFEHNQFSFALAEVALIRPATADDPIGFRVDLDYGPVTNWVHAAEPGGVEVFQHLQQAYISYRAPVGTGLTFDIGKFVTQHGAEVIEAKDNWNYSRSLLFSWAIPYYHAGIRAAYTVNDKVSLLAAVVNGWNNVKDNNAGKTYGVQAIVKPVTPLSVVINYMGGPEQANNTDDWRHLFDATVSHAVNEVVSVMGNYSYGRDTVAGVDAVWQGVGLYAKAQATSWFAVIPRYEYYDDEDGFTTGTAQSVQEFTLTGEIKHSRGLLMRVEYRRDWSNVNSFVRGGRPTGHQNTFTVGWVYAFSTRQ
ncbi:MAG TPA: porin [Vicinamibacterales bacterium]|nr:porin [Vicinamibacterales bacterium]